MYLGFDIGGTNIAGGVVARDGSLLAHGSRPFPHGKGPDAAADAVAAMAEELSSTVGGGLAESVGVALPGSLDPERKTVIHAHNIDFHQVPFWELLQARFPGKSVSLLNDGDAAALAELLFGALRGCKTGILLTLGTGLGGGLVLDGRLFSGGLGHGTEPGHIALAHDGEACTCGNRGCAEALCSAGWLARAGREGLAAAGPQSLLYKACGSDPAKIDARLVIDCAGAGDAVAMEIFDRYVDRLSDALTTYANLLDPEVIALGGGVSDAGEFLLAPLRAAVERKSFFKYPYKIVAARMGNRAGIAGAALWPHIT